MADSQRKTENLAPEIRSANGWVVGYLNGNDGSYNPNNYNGEWLSPNIPLTSGETITISAMSISYPSMSVYYWNGSTFMYGESANNYSGSSFTTPLNTTHIRFALRAGSDNKTEEAVISSGFWIMMNTGSTPLPYEPYGWLHSLRKLTTATDTFATLPADIYADGNNASVGLVGNTVQNGTPSPSAPVDVVGCGDITANILSVYKENYSINANGEETYNAVAMIYKANVVVSGSTFTLTFGGLSAGDVVRIHAYTGDTWKGQIASIVITQTPFVFTVASEVDNIRISIRKAATDVTMTDGQYKIPISSANTTTPVYLGEVQTTRKIQKWVLNGTEEGWKASGGFFYNESITPDYLRLVARTAYCTHYQAINNVTSGSSVGEGKCAFYSSIGVQRLYFKDSNYSTIAEFKQHLADEYANGTPVCVWYVLATPTTGIVNEPLQKIGGYADTVSGITIPTIAGANSFDVLTTLKPSEVELTYTGWHDASVKEWDGSHWNGV